MSSTPFNNQKPYQQSYQQRPQQRQQQYQQRKPYQQSNQQPGQQSQGQSQQQPQQGYYKKPAGKHFIFKNRPKLGPMPRVYRGTFKYKDGSGNKYDLGLFTKAEEGLAWTRVHQLLVNQEGFVPHGTIEFLQVASAAGTIVVEKISEETFSAKTEQNTQTSSPTNSDSRVLGGLQSK